MATVGRSNSKFIINKTRPRSSSDRKSLRGCEEFSSSSSVGEEDQSPTLNREDIQSLAIRTEDLEKLRAPKPPSKPKPKSKKQVLVRKTRPPDEASRKVGVVVARPLPHDSTPQPLDHAGPSWLRFDEQGMLLPHCILGSLEDFKREMELRGETELVKRIPDQQKQPPLVMEGEKYKDSSRIHLESGRDIQSHALQHWNHHMEERRKQQNFISQLLQRPAGDLLMNRSSRFRETQEQRDLISRGLPALHTGHVKPKTLSLIQSLFSSHSESPSTACPDQGRVGSEFWSLPERFGDEESGITATLTQTERGNPPPVTRIRQPYTTRLESGNVSDAVNRGRAQSQYLQQRRSELSDVLRDLELTSPPDIDGLEVVGSGLPFTKEPVRPSAPLAEREEEEEQTGEEEQKENKDPLAHYDDVIKAVELVPALRVCGDLARWTGDTFSHQGEVGVSVTLLFEAATGEIVNSDLELRNEGITAIYYSWENLTQPHTHTQHFYFNSNAASILPGSTKRIIVAFKSVYPGIKTEVWRLNTHPVLMGGASLEVTLWGVALCQDKNADQRAALERELDHKVAVSFCRDTVNDLLKGVHTPDRPSSPEPFITEEESFHIQNPHLQYHCEPVEELKSLWEQVSRSGGQTPVELPAWDLSFNSLRQVVLSLPEEDQETEGLNREKGLSQYNTLILQLQQPQKHLSPVSPHAIGLQLWREFFDNLASESFRLRQTLGLPEHTTWNDPTQEHNTLEQMKKEESEEKKGGTLFLKEEKRGAREMKEKRGGARLKAKEKPVEECGILKEKESEEKRRETEQKESSFTADSLEHTHRLQNRYRQLLHTQVCVLMERMVDSLCDLLDDTQQNQQDPHTTN